MTTKVEELVEELVEDVVTILRKVRKDAYRTYPHTLEYHAKQILSRPVLALIVRSLYKCPECGQGNFVFLAEALKQVGK